MGPTLQVQTAAAAFRSPRSSFSYLFFLCFTLRTVPGVPYVFIVHEYLSSSQFWEEVDQ